MNKPAEPAQPFIASLLTMLADRRHRKTFDAISADNDVFSPSDDQKIFWRPGS